MAERGRASGENCSQARRQLRRCRWGCNEVRDHGFGTQGSRSQIAYDRPRATISPGGTDGRPDFEYIASNEVSISANTASTTTRMRRIGCSARIRSSVPSDDNAASWPSGIPRMPHSFPSGAQRERQSEVFQHPAHQAVIFRDLEGRRAGQGVVPRATVSASGCASWIQATSSSSFVPFRRVHRSERTRVPRRAPDRRCFEAIVVARNGAEHRKSAPAPIAAFDVPAQLVVLLPPPDPTATTLTATSTR